MGKKFMQKQFESRVSFTQPSFCLSETLSPVADHGFVICTSDNFELVLKSETLTSTLNTGHFDLKLFVATLIKNA